MKVPSLVVPALLDKHGSKVEDIQNTSKASVRVQRPPQGGAWAQVDVYGSEKAASMACHLIKRTTRHTKAVEHTPPHLHYTRDERVEAQLNMLMFYMDTRAKAFDTKHPKDSS